MAKKILLVEDDVDLQELYHVKLTGEGFKVSSATTGEEALTMLGEIKPDLVVLDVMLGGKLNGFDVLESMRSGRDFQKLPVIVFTNLDNQEESAVRVGASDYLVKVNTTPQMIVDKIREKLSS